VRENLEAVGAERRHRADPDCTSKDRAEILDSNFVKAETMRQLYNCAQAHKTKYFLMPRESRKTGREHTFSPQRGQGSPSFGADGSPNNRGRATTGRSPRAGRV